MTTQPSTTREWGRGGFRTSSLGLGCWAIGGTWRDSAGNPLGWGRTDDDESIRAVRRAIELGVTFFDTADVYGAGHSERVLGRAITGHRDDLQIGSKWGNLFDESSGTMGGQDTSPEYVRPALLASLDRLGTDYLDVFQLHPQPSAEEGARLRDACEDLVAEGLIRGYAWSVDDPERAAVFAAGEHCVAVQHELSVLHDAPEMLALCDKYELASINRSPLAMGLLTGKYGATSRLGAGDIRSVAPEWLRWFSDGVPSPEWLARVEAIREVLTSDGRTLTQGALGWLWARSERTVPIPGFRTVAQVEENAAAMSHGPLRPERMAEIDRLLTGMA